jgi:hypothetical protein
MIIDHKRKIMSCNSLQVEKSCNLIKMCQSETQRRPKKTSNFFLLIFNFFLHCNTASKEKEMRKTFKSPPKKIRRKTTINFHFNGTMTGRVSKWKIKAMNLKQNIVGSSLYMGVCVCLEEGCLELRSEMSKVMALHWMGGGGRCNNK